MSFPQALNQINPKQLFLIDSLGALVSAFMLGVVLVQFENTGMPKNILYLLSFIPCVFAIYSFSCFLIMPKNWRFLLKVIAIANLLYCCLTLILMINLYQNLTVLGFIYFICEIIVVIILVIVELKIASQPAVEG